MCVCVCSLGKEMVVGLMNGRDESEMLTLVSMVVR